MSRTPPPVIIAPNAPSKHTVIWLHGLGADGHDFEPVIPALSLPKGLAVKFILPHAPIQPVTLNGGMPMRAWFDLYGLDFKTQQDKQGIARATASLTTLIENEIAAGIPASNIVLVGFSQGGALALHTALSYPRSLGGVIGLSTVLPLADQIETHLHTANATLPIFLAHGSLDPVLSINLGLMTKERLEELGYTVDWHEYPIGHTLCGAEIDAISQWLQTRFQYTH